MLKYKCHILSYFLFLLNITILIDNFVRYGNDTLFFIT